MSTKKTETLEDRAARLAAEMAEVNEEQARIERERAEHLAQAQETFDSEVVAAWNPGDLDAEVTEARRALDQAVADHPLTQAVTAYYVAAGKRHQRWGQYLGAVSRQGRNVAHTQAPPITELPMLTDLIDRAGQNAGSDWRATDAADFDTKRNTAPEGNR